jgi:hypothetical protein
MAHIHPGEQILVSSSSTGELGHVFLFSDVSLFLFGKVVVALAFCKAWQWRPWMYEVGEDVIEDFNWQSLETIPTGYGPANNRNGYVFKEDSRV